MIYILTTITVFFLSLIIYLILKIQSDRIMFQSKLQSLEEIMQQLYLEQKIQNNQMQLSDELKRKLHQINFMLNKDIYDLNYDMFHTLYPKKEI